jgi:predicted ATP-grasp superfamily ATP-dependent carboligase
VRVFVYEFITGGGLYRAALWPPPKSLLCEGKAIAGAILQDFAACESIRTSTLLDARLPLDKPPAKCDELRVASAREHVAAFDRCAALADWTLLVAPEFDGHLSACAQRVIEVGGRLLGPSLDNIQLTSDKHQTAQHLRANGVLTPRGVRLACGGTLPTDFPFPAVLKPIDGAGSQDVQLVRAADQAVMRRGVMRLEEYHRGTAASVAFLCGPQAIVPLLPCRQHLSDDGRFTYLGGSLPLPPALAERATRLGLAAVRTLPGLLGYIGVDIVLGDDEHGSQDVVIEINPRLTTSYVGLRAASRANLAAGMIAIAEGRDWEPDWTSSPVTFSADGTMGA